MAPPKQAYQSYQATETLRDCSPSVPSPRDYGGQVRYDTHDTGSTLALQGSNLGWMDTSPPDPPVVGG